MRTVLPRQELRIAFNAGLDLKTSLAPLGRWGDDGLDRFDGQRLARTVRLRGDVVVAYSAAIVGDAHAPELSVGIPAENQVHASEVAHEIEGTFVDPPDALAEVAGSDPEVARLLRRHPGVRPVLFPDPLAALVRSISAQQVNLRWAATIRRRIAECYGTRHEVGDTYAYSLDGSALAQASVEELRSLQLTTAKARSAIAVGDAAATGELDRHELEALDDDALIAHLTQLRGIGRWSAEWFLARTLGRPRVVAGDLGVRKAVARMYRTTSLPSEDEVRRLTAHWGAAATRVQAMALHEMAGTPPAA
jgi:DNA-3-methyladenine glycosylase II